MMQHMLRLLRPRWPVAALLLIWVTFFWRVLTPNMADRVTFQQGDFTLQFLAYRQLAFAQLSAGRLPTLEACLNAGHPFLADPQSQLFYPPVLALMGIGRALGWQTYPLRALEWEVMLHVLLAACGMFAFLRACGARQAAALFGATAFAYSGYLTGYAMLQTGILETAAWLPLMLLCARKLSQARALFSGSSVALAALGAIALFAGHPQTLLFALYACAVAYLWWSWPPADKPNVSEGAESDIPGRSGGISDSASRLRAADNLRALLRGALALFLAIGLSAAQLIPSALFMLNSTRAGLSFEDAGRGFALQDLSLLLLTGVSNVWQPLYVGVATLLFAACAFVWGGAQGNRETRLWLLIGAGALLLSFGANAFGFDLFYWLAPGYRQFQSQERHAVLVTFALAALGAHGLHAISCAYEPDATPRSRRVSAQLWAGAAFAFALLIAVVVAGALAPELQPRSAPVASRVALLALALTACGALFRWRAAQAASTGARAYWPAATLAILIVDLFTANRATATQPPADPFPQLPLIEAIKREARPNAAYERVYNHFGLPLNAACVNGLREVGSGSPIVWRDYKTFLDRAPEFVMMQLLNVRFAVTWRGAMTTREGVNVPWFLLARDQFEGKDASTYRLDWEPGETRGAWIGAPFAVANEEQLYAAMRAPGFEPFKTTPVFAADLNGRTGTGSADVEGRAAGYLKVIANASAPAIVSVSEAYHPNWVALVNGQRVRPVRVYGALIGVPVGAGPSSIELSYQPADVYAGLAISALSALSAGIALAAHRRRHR